MRKSNIIILAIFLVASIAFLCLWIYLDFNLIDLSDLIITIIWWVAIAVICFAIHHAEKVRCERLRTIFIADSALYNPEAGIVRLQQDDPQTLIDSMRNVLENLTYSTKVKVEQSNTYLRFNYVVHSKKFSNDGHVWEGDIIQVGGSEAVPFSGYQQLRRILTDVKAV